MNIREIRESDWPALYQLQVTCYPKLTESEASMRSKQSASPQTCLVYEATDGRLVGYCLAHPYPLGQAPKLDQIINEVVAGDNLYLHDLAVEKSYRGQGIAEQLFLHLKGCAVKLGYSSMSLVAVQNAAPFWSRMGFCRADNPPSLSSYGTDAWYMTSSLR